MTITVTMTMTVAPAEREFGRGPCRSTVMPNGTSAKQRPAICSIENQVLPLSTPIMRPAMSKSAQGSPQSQHAGLVGTNGQDDPARQSRRAERARHPFEDAVVVADRAGSRIDALDVHQR